MTSPLPVLVTACGGDLGQSIIKAMRLDNMDLFVHGTDANAHGIGAAFVHDFHVLPFASSPHYMDEISALIVAHGIRAILPSSEQEIAVLTRERAHLEGLGAKLICQEDSWIATYGEKLTCMSALEGKVPLAPFCDGDDEHAVREFIAHNTYPFIIKARASRGSTGVRLVRDAAEMRAALSELDGPILQGYIEDTYGEFSIGAFGHGGNYELVAFQRTLGVVGCSWFAQVDQDAEVLDYARDVARATGLVGSANIQVRKSAQGVRLLEINPRFSSLSSARAACGFNDVAWSMRQALSMPLELTDVFIKEMKFQRFFGELVDFGAGFKRIEAWDASSHNH